MDKAYRRKQDWLLAVFCMVAFFGQAVASYQSVFMKDHGFTATQVGLTSSVVSVVSLAGTTFWGFLSDRSGSLKRVLMGISAAAMIIYGLVPTVSRAAQYQVLAMVAVIAVMQFFFNPMMNLTENLLVRNCSELNLNYGKHRSIAAFSYAMGGFAVSFLVSKAGVESSFVATALLALPMVLIMLPMHDGRDLQSPQERAAEKAHRKEVFGKELKELLTDHAFLIFLAAVLLESLASAGRYGFVPYFMSHIGVSTDSLASLLGFGALLEIPAFLLLGRFHDRFGYRNFYIVGLSLYMCSSFIYATICRDLPTLLLAQVFSGIGGGFYLGSVYNYVFELSPANVKATAQTFFTTVSAIAGILGSSLGGFLFDHLNIRWFYGLMTFIYLLSILLILTDVFIIRRKKQRAR